MLINWFTVVAQAINFLILVWLLKRFLYKPILHAIDEREKGIATQLAEAEAKKAEAQKERDDFQHKNEAFDQERAALLKKATDEANAERQRLLDEARKDADALRAKRQDALRNEQRNLSQEIIRWTQKEVFAITRKTLADLATMSLEERMGDVFVRRVRALDRRGQGAVGGRLQDVEPDGERAQRVRSAAGTADRDRKCGEGNVRPGRSGPVRDRAGAGQRHRTLHQRTEGGLEHRGLSRDAGKERRRTFARGRPARTQPDAKSKPGRPRPSPSRKPPSRSQARA